MKLTDEYFSNILNDNYFANNVRINLSDLSNDEIPRMILIKNNRFTEKALKTFKDIFLSFSNKEEMNKDQLYIFFIQFFQKKNDPIIRREVNNCMLTYDSNRDGKLTFDVFIKLIYNELIILEPKIIWKYLNNLGYNNLLDKKKKIDFHYLLNNIDECEGYSISIIRNFWEITKKIYINSLYSRIFVKIILHI